jgi:glucose/arabinose dehydrogenase
MQGLRRYSASGRWANLLFTILCLSIMPGRQVEAASVPVGFSDRQIASNLNSPTALTVLPDGRVLVIQQAGRIRVIKSDALLPDNFYAVPAVDSFAERGCLGITSDPDFVNNHFIYIYCSVSDGVNSHNRILRLTEANDVAVPGSERVVLDLPNIDAGVQWHMGGALHFGIDGKLYVAVGGHEDNRLDPAVSNSQKMANPFGKILRINPDGSIPLDNPFVGTPGAYTGIFSLGLRNPFQFDIQQGTGLILINDVGAGSVEEINRGIAGANYGWPEDEGQANDPRFVNPVFEYSHTVGCAITGGAFYNPPNPQFPAQYVGKYFYSDFCNGTIKTIDPANPTKANDFASGIDSPVNHAVAPDGSLYYLARNQNANTSTNGGTLSKINFTDSQAPRITQSPQNQAVFMGEPVTFVIAADGATGFQWRRNGADIPGATTASYTLATTTAADNQASYSVLVRNGSGEVVSNAATLTVSNDHFPIPTIDRPAENDRFAPGDTILYSGSGTDAEDGALPPSAMTWQVSFQHDTHSHPFIAPTSGAASGSFNVSDFESDAANTWFRVTLTVKDSKEQNKSTTRDIYPRDLLSDLTPVGTPINGRGPIEMNRSNGEVAPGDGSPITLGRIPYVKGLGVFAPSDVRYQLDGQCAGHFITDVGIDDAAGIQGSVVFQVFLDGAKAFDSGVMRGGELRKTVNLALAGKKELRLVVTDGGDGNAFDLADWAGARVTGCPANFAAQSTAGTPANATPSGAALTPPTGGGGGCSIGGDGSFDPILAGLVALAFGVLIWRLRRKS